MASNKTKPEFEKKIQTNPDLPWWVELLFVQIGFPDKWLPKILRRKNIIRKYMDENKIIIKYLIIISIGFMYTLPSYKYFQSQNSCIKYQELKSLENNNFSSRNKLKIKADAVKMCNGA